MRFRALRSISLSVAVASLLVASAPQTVQANNKVRTAFRNAGAKTRVLAQIATFGALGLLSACAAAPKNTQELAADSHATTTPMPKGAITYSLAGPEGSSRADAATGTVIVHPRVHQSSGSGIGRGLGLRRFTINEDGSVSAVRQTWRALERGEPKAGSQVTLIGGRLVRGRPTGPAMHPMPANRVTWAHVAAMIEAHTATSHGTPYTVMVPKHLTKQAQRELGLAIVPVISGGADGAPASDPAGYVVMRPKNQPGHLAAAELKLVVPAE